MKGRWKASRSPRGQAVGVDGSGWGVGIGKEVSKMKPRARSGSLGYKRATPETGTERRWWFAVSDIVSVRDPGITQG